MKTLILALVVVTAIFLALNILFPLTYISGVVYIGGYIGTIMIWAFTSLEM